MIKVLLVIILSLLIYYLGASYVIQKHFKQTSKPISYMQACGIFNFLIQMAIKYPYKGHRASGIFAVIFLYQIFNQIFKTYYITILTSRPELDASNTLSVAKIKFEDRIYKVYSTLDGWPK